MNKNKRPQAPKPRNQAFNQAMQEKGRSSAASPMRPKTQYKRKPKHSNRQEW